MDQEEQQAVLLGGHYGQPNRYLVDHMAEMHGKWPMAACYFWLCESSEQEQVYYETTNNEGYIPSNYVRPLKSHVTDE